MFARSIKRRRAWGTQLSVDRQGLNGSDEPIGSGQSLKPRQSTK